MNDEYIESLKADIIVAIKNIDPKEGSCTIKFVYGAVMEYIPKKTDIKEVAKM